MTALTEHAILSVASMAAPPFAANSGKSKSASAHAQTSARGYSFCGTRDSAGEKREHAD